MQRVALVLLVATLSFSVSGLSSMFVPEPCTVGERSGTDNRCPPMCVTCGCCHRSVDVTRLVIAGTQAHVATEMPPLVEQLRSAAPGEILHVPKAHGL